MWIFGQTAALRSADGALLGYVGSATDVTELHLMREKLRRSAEQLEATVSERTQKLFQMALAVESIDRVEVRQAHRIAYEILDKMATKKREVFILSELEGLSGNEIAAITDTKIETVASRLHYARREFAERLGKKRGVR